jgi:hypothetical protein
MILFRPHFSRAYHAGLIILLSAHLGSSVLGIFDILPLNRARLLAGEF